MKTLRASIALTGVASLLFIAACSGTSEPPIATGGDPMVPSARAAWSLSFAPAVLDPTKCPVDAHDAAMGEVTASTKTSLRNADTDLDASADCTIFLRADGAFKVQGNTRMDDKVLSIQIPALNPGATLSAPSTGTLNYSSSTTVEPYVSPSTQPCSFYFADGTMEGVAFGELWLSFQCPAVVGEKTASICSVTKGVAAFQGCFAQ